MKKLILLFVLPALIITAKPAQAQLWRDILGAVTKTSGTSPTNTEISSALKQALELGTTKSSDKLSALNGFFMDAEVKLLFPPEAQKAEKTLRSLGFGKLCDNVILSLNRAAEGAAKEAKPIFVNAVKQMTLQDVMNILLGSSDSATQYFKRSTALQLAAKFEPVVKTNLDKVNATRYYASAATTYNKVPFVKKINPDIVDYVTNKAIDGLFIQIAKEELNIRQNLSARTTPLLQKVFGYADKQKKY